MTRFNAKSFLFLLMLFALYVGCKKKDKAKPQDQSGLTFTLDNHSGRPGELIQVKTEGRFEADVMSISIGGVPVDLYKINDTLAVFTLPVLGEGKANIDLSGISGKPVSFVVNSYTPVTDPEAVKQAFTRKVSQFIERADTAEDQSFMPVLKGLQEAFLSQYDALSEADRMAVAYTLREFNQVDLSFARKAVFPSAQQGGVLKGTATDPDGFVQMARQFVLTVTPAVLAIGGGYYVVKGAKGKEKLLGAAAMITGLVLMKKARKTEYDLIDRIFECFKLDNLLKRVSSGHRQSSGDSLSVFAREYDMVFTPGEAVSRKINGQYRSLSEANLDQSPFYKELFGSVYQLAFVYGVIKNSVETIRGWGSLFASVIPEFPAYDMAIPKEAMTGTWAVPAEDLVIERVSDPDITLKATADGESFALTATGKGPANTREFTFDIVYRHEELGVEVRKTVQAVYVVSGLSVTAIAIGDTATLSVVGGVPPYAFEWSNGAKDSILYGLDPGEYYVVVTDALDSAAVGSVVIAPGCEHSDLKVTVEAAGSSATAAAEGGSPAYTYAWSNGTTGDRVTELDPGDYTVVVTDVMGCRVSANVTIEGQARDSLALDAAAVKTILQQNGLDVSDSRWDSEDPNDLQSVLTANGCGVSDDRVVSLKLYNKGLTKLPAAIGALTNLVTLDANTNKLTSLPKEIGNLTRLTLLKLDYNQLQAIPGEIGKLINLKTLQLSSNKLSSIPGSIGNLVRITDLRIQYNQLTSLPPEIANLTNLTVLHLGNNQLSTLPSGIEKLTQLTSLRLSNNQLTSLPSAIGSLTNLNSLNISDNRLTDLPSFIGNLTNLTDLHLDHNQLTSLPYVISNLKNLTLLGVSYNQLTNFEPAVGLLSKLTELRLEHNQLTSVPSEIGNLTGLTKLTLNDNQLTHLPSTIGNLTQLPELDLSQNKLPAIPAEIGNMASLKTLKINYNQLVSIPAEIGKLSGLTSLAVYQNRLTSVPSTIGNLTNLKGLGFKYNMLTSLPAEIGNLTNLTALVLDYNRLTSLPSSFGNLKNLSSLEVSYNQLTSIPASLGSLTKLTYLNLMSNKLNCLPQSVWDLNPERFDWRINGICSAGDTNCADIPCADQ